MKDSQRFTTRIVKTNKCSISSSLNVLNEQQILRDRRHFMTPAARLLVKGGRSPVGVIIAMKRLNKS